MKNTMIKKTWFTGLLMIVLAFQIQAQDIDSERMKRDLAVTENVLSTLLGETSDSKILVGFRNRKVSSDYIKDYGVIFTVNNGFGSGLYIAPNVKGLHSTGFHFTPDSDVVIGKAPRARSDKKQDERAKAEEEEKSEEELQKEAKADFIKASEDFLADYVHLISQLKTGDHIMIRMTSGWDSGLSWGRNYVIDVSPDDLVDHYSEEMTSEEVMVEASVSDIEALRKGQLSRDAFLKTVKVTEVERSHEKKPDLEIISTMFSRLYQRDLSDTYYTLSNIRYSSVKGVGVVYRMRVYSSYESDNVFFIPSTGDKNLNLEERNKKVQELLPEFIQSFKENLINYGRSIKSLEANELLIFEVKLTKCKECTDFPKALKFSVKKSVLDDFNGGKISESQAIDQVNVEKEM